VLHCWFKIDKNIYFYFLALFRNRAIIRDNRRSTIIEVAEDVEISYSSYQDILTNDLDMSRIAAKFITRFLTDEQKQNREVISQEFLEGAETDPEFFF